MISKIALILALGSQVFAAFGRTAFVLCVHESGRTEIEFRGSLCCKESKSEEDDRGDIGNSATVVCTDEDPCSDYPVLMHQARSEAASSRSDLGTMPQRAVDVPSFAATITPSITLTSGSISIATSALQPEVGSASIARLRTVILLV